MGISEAHLTIMEKVECLLLVDILLDCSSHNAQEVIAWNKVQCRIGAFAGSLLIEYDVGLQSNFKIECLHSHTSFHVQRPNPRLRFTPRFLIIPNARIMTGCILSGTFWMVPCKVQGTVTSNLRNE